MQRFIKGLTSISHILDTFISLFHSSVRMFAFLLNTSKKVSNIWKWKAGVNKRRASFHSDPLTNKFIIGHFKMNNKSGYSNLLIAKFPFQAKVQPYRKNLYWCSLCWSKQPKRTKPVWGKIFTSHKSVVFWK